jgi:hypothetical protein
VDDSDLSENSNGSSKASKRPKSSPAKYSGKSAAYGNDEPDFEVVGTSFGKKSNAENKPKYQEQDDEENEDDYNHHSAKKISPPSKAKPAYKDDDGKKSSKKYDFDDEYDEDVPGPKKRDVQYGDDDDGFAAASKETASSEDEYEEEGGTRSLNAPKSTKSEFRTAQRFTVFIIQCKPLSLSIIAYVNKGESPLGGSYCCSF